MQQNWDHRSEDAGCRKAQSLMSAFIDSMTRNDEVAELEAHLATCAACQRQLQAYVSVRNLLRSAEEPAVPVDLALATRVRLSHERIPSSATRLWARLEMFAANTIRPFALPVVTGVLSTVLLFGVMLEDMKAYGEIPTPPPASTRPEVTEPTYTRIERFPMGLTQPMFVEVHVDDKGKVSHYMVLSGPYDNPLVDTWLDDLLFTAVFKPATSAGQPINATMIMALPGFYVGVDES